MVEGTGSVSRRLGLGLIGLNLVILAFLWKPEASTGPADAASPPVALGQAEAMPSAPIARSQPAGVPVLAPVPVPEVIPAQEEASASAAMRPEPRVVERPEKLRSNMVWETELSDLPGPIAEHASWPAHDPRRPLRDGSILRVQNMPEAPVPLPPLPGIEGPLALPEGRSLGETILPAARSGSGSNGLVSDLSPLDDGANKISIKSQGEEIRRVLELLSTQASVNILSSPGVVGVIDINLQDVSFENALNVILKLANLKAREENGVVYVYTANEFATIEAQERTPIVRVYHLNYARAEDVASMLSPFLSETGSISLTPPSQQGIGPGSGSGGGGGGGSGALLGGGMAGGIGGAGGVSSDAAAAAGAPMGGGGRLSTAGTSVSGSETGGNSMALSDMLIVRDYAENIATMDEIVARLDVEPIQVLIEAVILSVELTDDQELGVNFGLVDNLATMAAVSGSGGLINAAAGFIPARVLSTASSQPGYMEPRGGQLVGGYTTPDHGLKFGFVDRNVSGFIRALESLNKLDILASPRILVLNKQKAEIQLGRRLGYRNTITNLTSSLQTVQFLSVGTLLALRPYVSTEGMIRLEIHPEKSTGFLDSQGIPQTNTSELTTNIMVPDGATIVIGGLMDSEDSIAEQGVLGLSRLPVLGPLFRARNVRANKRELIVLLTPRLLSRGGLPQPVPGVAPRGPSGVPNSGPMPGPSGSRMALNPGAPNQVRQDLTRAGTDTDATLDGEATQAVARVQDAPGRITDRATPSQAGVPVAPVEDQPLRDDVSVLPTSLEATTFDPKAEVRSTPPQAIHPALGQPIERLTRFGDKSNQAAKPPGADAKPRGYRPGDLTAAAARWVTRPFRKARSGASSPEPKLDDEPVSLASHSIEPTIAQHVVQTGEDFGKLAARYYGTASLRMALWSVNRHIAPSADRLEPGTSIMLPPAEVLEQVVSQAVTQTSHESPASRPESTTTRRWKLFAR